MLYPGALYKQLSKKQECDEEFVIKKRSAAEEKRTFRKRRRDELNRLYTENQVIYLSTFPTRHAQHCPSADPSNQLTALLLSFLYGQNSKSTYQNRSLVLGMSIICQNLTTTEHIFM